MRLHAIRIAAVLAGVLLLLWGLSRVLVLSPGIPLWLAAVVFTAAVELILFLYRYEGSAVDPKRSRRILALRLAALAVLGWILLEPAWVREVKREPRRKVVFVYDESESMNLKDDGAADTRIAIGRKAVKDAKLEETLREAVDTVSFSAARTLLDDPETAGEGWRDTTDIAGSLESLLERVPSDEIGGVVMVTDGRHNGPAPIEDAARRFGILDAPIGIISVGSDKPPRDAAVVSLEAPDSLYEGDRMRVLADLKFDGLRGKSAKVVLRQGAKELDQRTLAIPQDSHREQVRFSCMPEIGNNGQYEVEILALEGERFTDNNRVKFETSVTDARTHVLLVDNHPRWEFRYLRNLFYGRDKSVHLQYVLLQPDRIEGQVDPPVPASASRPFGDARATLLPQTEEEWRKFDVIIFGDLPPQAIGEEQWGWISKSVRERAAMLVMIAGPRHFPRLIESQAGRDLVPAELDWDSTLPIAAPPKPFRFALTAEGMRHPATRQSSGTSSNEEMWAQFPEIQWRHPVVSLKEGAELLLTAAEDEEDLGQTGSAGMDAALDVLAQRREREIRSALLVTRQTGRGRVALLLTDRMWRLREGAGDVFHHRFWGNLVRWGAGPMLRAGGQRVRLGTDRLVYTPDERPLVTARLRDASLNPVEDRKLTAEVTRNGEKIASMELRPSEEKNGLHEAALDPFREPGKYEVRLKGKEAERLTVEDGGKEPMVSFTVAGSRGPVETAETTRDPKRMEAIATLSNGKVVAPAEAASLAALFLGDREERKEIRETSLWDNLPVLLLLVSLLGSEWVLRRSGGLP